LKLLIQLHSCFKGNQGIGYEKYLLSNLPLGKTKSSRLDEDGHELSPKIFQQTFVKMRNRLGLFVESSISTSLPSSLSHTL
jgi:hypothetical protein